MHIAQWLPQLVTLSSLQRYIIYTDCNATRCTSTTETSKFQMILYYRDLVLTILPVIFSENLPKGPKNTTT